MTGGLAEGGLRGEVGAEVGRILGHGGRYTPDGGLGGRGGLRREYLGEKEAGGGQGEMWVLVGSKGLMLLGSGGGDKDMLGVWGGVRWVLYGGWGVNHRRESWGQGALLVRPVRLKRLTVATITVVDTYSLSKRVTQDIFIVYEPLLLLAVVYMIMAGLIVLLFKWLESRVPSRTA